MTFLIPVTLTNPTDEDLNNIFTIRIAGFSHNKYTASIAAVLPWLENWRDRPYLYRMAQIDCTGNGWLVKLYDAKKPDLIVKQEDPSLARAIVLGLLAHYAVDCVFYGS